MDPVLFIPCDDQRLEEAFGDISLAALTDLRTARTLE